MGFPDRDTSPIKAKWLGDTPLGVPLYRASIRMDRCPGWNYSIPGAYSAGFRRRVLLGPRQARATTKRSANKLTQLEAIWWPDPAHGAGFNKAGDDCDASEAGLRRRRRTDEGCADTMSTVSTVSVGRPAWSFKVTGWAGDLTLVLWPAKPCGLVVAIHAPALSGLSRASISTRGRRAIRHQTIGLQVRSFGDGRPRGQRLIRGPQLRRCDRWRHLVGPALSPCLGIGKDDRTPAAAIQPRVRHRAGCVAGDDQAIACRTAHAAARSGAPGRHGCAFIQHCGGGGVDCGLRVEWPFRCATELQTGCDSGFGVDGSTAVFAAATRFVRAA